MLLEAVLEKSQRENILLSEWITANKRIDNIDARIWQGAGILLVISIGGFSILNWKPPHTLIEYLSTMVIAIISVIVLLIWQRVYQRWQYMQSIYGHRAREIELELGLCLKLNSYARILEYYGKSNEETKSVISRLKEDDNESYKKLLAFRGKQDKSKKFGRTCDRRILRNPQVYNT